MDNKQSNEQRTVVRQAVPIKKEDYEKKKIMEEQQQKRLQELKKEDELLRKVEKRAEESIAEYFKVPWYLKIWKFFKKLCLIALLVILFIIPTKTGSDDVVGGKIIYAVNPITKIAFCCYVEDTSETDDGKLIKEYKIIYSASGYATKLDGQNNDEAQYELGDILFGYPDKDVNKEDDFSWWECIEYAVFRKDD